MKKFTIEKSNCPFEFFSEIGFEHKPFVISLIQQKIEDYSQSECEEVYERNCDEIDDNLCCEDLHFLIDSYWVGEHEEDESSGTWGYSHYEVDDVNQAHEDIKKEITSILENFLSKLQKSK
jgi:hypothetical protein